jgi:hypothetical protein
MSDNCNVYEKIVDTLDGHIVLEKAYYNEAKELIGYWAHGYFDHELPFQGQYPVKDYHKRFGYK